MMKHVLLEIHVYIKTTQRGYLNGLKKKGLIKGAYVTFKKISLKNVSIFLEFKNLIATHWVLVLTGLEQFMFFDRLRRINCPPKPFTKCSIKDRSIVCNISVVSV